jgi:hypothetical protein
MCGRSDQSNTGKSSSSPRKCERRGQGRQDREINPGASTSPAGPVAAPGNKKMSAPEPRSILTSDSQNWMLLRPINAVELICLQNKIVSAAARLVDAEQCRLSADQIEQAVVRILLLEFVKLSARVWRIGLGIDHTETPPDDVIEKFLGDEKSRLDVILALRAAQISTGVT